MTDVDWEYINFELEESADSLTEITKTHWILSDSRSTCNNNACKKKFTLLERKHHCRRCGEVFCNTCLQFRGRLSFLAQYDPNGKLYKVCSTCFEEGADNDLTTNSLTKLYKEYKEDKNKPWTTDGLGQSSKLKSSRDRLDLSKECQRLREGFIKSVGNSEMKRTLHEMKVLISTPNWQKSSIWMVESLSERCQACISGFGLLKTKYTCKLCGVVLCKQCIHKEMLVYMPDGCDIKTVQLAELVIIKVVGSPEVEPELSLLLHVCSPCKQFLMNKQITEHEESVRAKTKQVTVIDSLELIDEKLSPLQYRIVNQLSKYQEVVESLEDGSRSSGDGSNTKVLAKSQDDLSDFFSELVLKLPSVKKLQDLAETPTQHKYLKNYLKAKSDFYIQNINTFKALKRKLSESAGPQILEYIQRIVDKNAIVSAQIYVRQLVFESLYLCQKYSLKGVVPDLLNTLDETIENDATKCLTSQGEDMTEHSEHLKNIVKSQIKGHRLVRISKTQYAAEGSKHVAELLLRRLSDILGQVNVQLQMKSINRSFQPTKSALEKCRSEAVQLTINDLL